MLAGSGQSPARAVPSRVRRTPVTWRIRASEQACKAWVGAQANQLEADEPIPDHGQRAKVAARLIEIPAFEQEDGVSAVGPKVGLADDTRLDQRPQCGGLIARKRQERRLRRAGRLRLKGEDAHGVLRPAGGVSPAGRQ
jgi:hypothetical protein